MPKAMALETDFLIVEVVRLQCGKNELTVQGSSCADLIYQLDPSQCSFYLLREGGWGWIWSGLP